MKVDGVREWITVDAPEYDDGDFPAIGSDLDARLGLGGSGSVGMAACRLLPMPIIVDAAADLMRARR